MSRPYPVGEKVAGHKLASLYIIIITMLAGCTIADFNVRIRKFRTAANACALQEMDCLRTHEEE